MKNKVNETILVGKKKCREKNYLTYEEFYIHKVYLCKSYREMGQGCKRGVVIPEFKGTQLIKGKIQKRNYCIQAENKTC